MCGAQVHAARVLLIKPADPADCASCRGIFSNQEKYIKRPGYLYWPFLTGIAEFFFTVQTN
jgi:hypothetical protein